MSADDEFKVLRDHDVNPLRASDLLDAATHKDWRDWLPEQIDDFVGGLSIQALDKILAIQVALTNEDVTSVWPLFNSCVVAFNHRRVNFSVLDVPTVPETAWGVTVLKALNPQGIFSVDVERYIGCIAANDGLVYFPWANVELNSWSEGLMNTADLTKRVKEAWTKLVESHDVSHESADEADPLQAQLGKLLRAQSYIDAQPPRN